MSRRDAVLFLIANGLSMAVGVNAALAFLLNGYWMDPVTALFYCLGTIVLCATLLTALRVPPPSRWNSG